MPINFPTPNTDGELYTFGDTTWSWNASSSTWKTADVGDAATIGGSNTQILFNDNGIANGSSDLVFIKSTGSVGIGRNPGYQLDVDLDINAGRYVYAGVAHVGNMLAAVASDPNPIQIIHGNSNPILFLTAGGTEHVRIEDSGNVGVGTTSPSQKLHVNNGSVLISNGNYATTTAGISTLYLRGGAVGGGGPNNPYGELRFSASNPGNALENYGATIRGYYTSGIDTGALLFLTGQGVVPQPYMMLSSQGSAIFSGNAIADFNTYGNDHRLIANGNSLVLGPYSYFGSTNSTRVQIISQGGPNAISEYYQTEENPRWQLGRDTYQNGRSGLALNFVGYSSDQGGVAIAAPTRGEMALATSNNTALVERVRITSTGNVGIGTTSPTSKLHVNGTSNITSTAVFGDTVTAQNKLRIGSDGGSDGQVSSLAGGYLRLTASGGRILSLNTFMVANLSTNFGDMTFATDIDNNGQEVMRLTSGYGGRVGIGTTSPSDKLHIANANVIVDGVGGGRIGFFAGDPAGYAVYREGTVTWVKSRGAVAANAEGDWIYLQSPVQYGVKIQTGNVSIGDVAYPGAKLHISSHDPINPALRAYSINDGIGLHVASGNGANYSSQVNKSNNMYGISVTGSLNNNTMQGIWFASGNAEGVHWSGVAGSRENATASSWATKLVFYTHNEDLNDLDGATEKMVITGAGNVGIGTTSPSEKLQVVGNINAHSLSINTYGTVVNTTGYWLGKPIQPRVNSAASFTSPLAWNSDNFDVYAATAQAEVLTINADSGSPVNGQKIIFRLKDNGTGRALTWTTGASKAFRAIGVTLPTTTVANKTTYVGCIYNTADSRWDAIAVTTEA